MKKKFALYFFIFSISVNLYAMDTSATKEYYLKIYETLRPRHNSNEQFLAVCIQTGSYFLAEYIVKNTTVNFNYVDQQKRTFIHIAVLAKIFLKTKCDFLQFLLRKEINVNAQDNQGNTALHYACLQMSPEIMETLLKHGASLDIPNKKHKTARNIILETSVHPSHWDKLEPRITEKHRAITILLQNYPSFSKKMLMRNS